MKAAQLPSKIKLKTQHLLKARLSQKHNMPAMTYYADPRLCPLAIALRERIRELFGEPHDVGIFEACSEVVFENGETFRADHSASVEEFVKWQDDQRTGDGPPGIYEFHWYRVIARRRRPKDITELIGSRLISSS
jgi:hypothetical protein